MLKCVQNKVTAIKICETESALTSNSLPSPFQGLMAVVSLHTVLLTVDYTFSTTCHSMSSLCTSTELNCMAIEAHGWTTCPGLLHRGARLESYLRPLDCESVASHQLFSTYALCSPTPLTPSTPAVPNCGCLKGPAPYWSNPPVLISDIRALWRSGLTRVPECQQFKVVG